MADFICLRDEFIKSRLFVSFLLRKKKKDEDSLWIKMKTILKDDYFAYPENQIKFKIRPKSTTTFVGQIEHPTLRI